MVPVVSNVINNVQKHCVVDGQRKGLRVPPVMITSMARSGKTTLLIEVYRALVADTKFEAILVTFNGQSGFTLRVDESPTVGFCRGLHEQLMGVTNHMAPSVDALKDYLAKCTKPLVLLVDELNSLTPDVDTELAILLREEFLDRPNRYLVFTCHHRMPLSEALGSRGIENSPRPSVSIGVPTSLVIADYNAIFGDHRKISPVELAQWGGLCGLAWSIQCTDFNANIYFNERLDHCPPDNLPEDPDTHSAFVKQICSGARHPKMTRYQRYTYLPSTHLSKEGCPIWPLCYIAAFLTSANYPILSQFIASVIKEVSGMEQGTGIEWQAIVLAAVAIRIHSASISNLHGHGHVELVVGPVQKDTQFMIVALPREVVDVAGAEAYVRSCVKVGSRSVVLAYATHPSFKIFDGLIIHFDGSDITMRHGLQAKQGRTGAGSDVPEGWRGFLFRGQAPQRKRMAKVSGWVYMTEDQVTNFLPVSLRGLLPGMWPSGT